MGRRVPEILAPAGDLETLKAAVNAGADAVYFGGSSFNARRSAVNFTLDDIREAVKFTSLRGVKTNMTLNTLVKEKEWSLLKEYLDEIVPLGVDAFILQDMGVVKALAEKLAVSYPSVHLHASTQMAVEDLEGVKLLEDLGFSRVVLAREVPVSEIARIRSLSKAEIEVFVHGALCYSDSGRCLLSSFHGGRSGNRGACAQPCRMLYEIDGKKAYYLNLKDRWAAPALKDLMEAGVDSLKIEGRMKSLAYVAGVTSFYRDMLDQYELTGKMKTDPEKAQELMQLFNRGSFTDGYYYTKKTKPSMIEGESPKNQGLVIGEVTSTDKGRVRIHSEKELHQGDELEITVRSGDLERRNVPIRLSRDMIAKNAREASFRIAGRIMKGDKVRRIVDPVLNEEIKKGILETKKIPVDLTFYAKKGEKILLTAQAEKQGRESEGESVMVCAEGEIPQAAVKAPMTQADIEKRLSKMGETPFVLRGFQAEMEEDLFLPVGALNEIRRECLQLLEKELSVKESVPAEILKKRRPFTENENRSEEKELTGSFELYFTHMDQVRAMETLDKTGVTKVVLAMEGFTEDKEDLLREIRKIFPESSVIIALPVCGTGAESRRRDAFIEREMKAWKDLGITEMEASRMGQIRKIRDFGLKASLSPEMGVMNAQAAKMMKKLTGGTYAISREITLEEICALTEKEAGGSLVIYGRVPYMITEQCPYKERYGCHAQKDGHHLIMRDRQGEDMHVLSHCPLCYALILSEKPVYLKSHETLSLRKRVEWTLENRDEIEEIWPGILEGNLQAELYTSGHFEKEVQ